jgi:hypothetical protein
LYETVRQNFVFDSHRAYLRDCLFGRSTRLQEDGQELPDEQWWGMQLRQELRLLIKRRLKAQPI